MKIFILYHVGKEESIAAYASNKTMKEFLYQWNPKKKINNMTLQDVYDFILFMDSQEEAKRIVEIEGTVFGISVLEWGNREQD